MFTKRELSYVIKTCYVSEGLEIGFNITCSYYTSLRSLFLLHKNILLHWPEMVVVVINIVL